MWVRTAGSAAIGIALVSVMGCGKDTDLAPDARAEPDPAATVESPRPSAPSSARVAASASASPSVAHPSEARALLSSSSSAAAPVPPPHPLALWMRGPATRAFESGDLDAIAASFDRMAGWAPAGYANWASIATDGAEAARAGSVAGIKAACRGCHAEYEAQYRSTLATRPLS